MERIDLQKKTDCDVEEVLGLYASYLLCNIRRIEHNKLIGYPDKLLQLLLGRLIVI